MNPTVLSEHRWSPRAAREVEVALCRSGMTRFTARSRDLSLGGVFVALDPAVMSPDAEVVITFVPSPQGPDTELRVPARVVHLERNGAGLMFTHFPPSLVHGLHDMLRAATAAPSRKPGPTGERAD